MLNKAKSSQDSLLFNEAYDYLVEAITTFKIPPNAPISENRLAKTLGISRTPIRQALQRLEAEGLITKSDSSRFTVSLVTPKQVEETCDLLQIRDTFLFIQASKNMEKESREQLLKITPEMIVEAEKDNRDNWSKADTAYHDLIFKAADNQMMANIALIHRRKIQRFWTRSAQYESRLAVCSKEHEVLAKAIVNQDIAAIEPAVSEHIDHMRTSILKIIGSTAQMLS